MSVPNAGPTPVALAIDAEDVRKSLPDINATGQPDSDEDRPIAPDQFDPKYETSKWEIWAYYS